MLTTINGIFENGKVILSENPPLKNKSKVLVTFIDEIDINKINQKDLHAPGIEPGSTAWQAAIIPLNQACFTTHRIPKKKIQ